MGGEQTFFEKIKRFLEPVLANKKTCLEVIYHHGIHGITGIIFIIFLQAVFKILEFGTIHELYNALIIFGGIFALQQFLFYLSRAIGWTSITNKIAKYSTKKYFPIFIRMDNNLYEGIGTGKTIAVISKGVKTWGILIDNLIMNGIGSIMSILFVIYMISQVSILILAIFLICLFLGLLASLYLNKKVVYHRNIRYTHDNKAISKMVKIIMSKYEILQSGKINSEIEKLNIEFDGKTMANIGMSKPLILFFIIPDVLVFIVLYSFIYYFGYLYFNGDISLSVLTGASGALILIQKELLNTMRLIKDFVKEFSEIEKLWDFFDTTPEIQGYDTGAEFKHTTGSVEIKNMTYGYDESNPVFQNFSLTLPGSQVTAIVGSSGSGKSTLVKLIAGYIRPNSGDVIIDTQKLSEVSLKSYYQDIGYLTQEPSVFDGTILENLTYALADGEASVENIDHIIKLAKCEFIYDFPNGLDTEIGEKGIRLSGGQRQRLAIAKIFLKNPKIIILDEPTSALDSFSEEQITIAMHNLFKGRTVIIIAHRLQTVKSADDIILLENGEVQERGTHSELVKKKGVYKKMLDLQSGF